MKFILMFVALFAATEAKAFWGPAEYRWFSEFASEKARFPDRYASTVWGAVYNPPDARATSDEHIPYMSGMVETRSFRTGWVEANMLIQSEEDDEERRVKAPLLIIMPGLFNDAEGDGTTNLAALFWRKGYHVIAIPSPWSPRSIRHKPLSKPGNLVVDAQVVLEIIRGMIAKIGMENITSVSLMGESYGGILGAAVYGTDQKSASPIITGTVMLVSPPLNLRDGAARLDEGMHKNELRYQECSTLSILCTVFKQMISNPLATQASLNAKVLSCMEPLVYRNFQEYLTRSAGAMKSSLIEEAGDDEYLPDPDAEARLTPRLKGMRFSKVFDTLMPENKPLLVSPMGDLSHWTNMLPPASLKRLRIVSAKDDLLNVGKVWDERESPAYSQRTTFLLPWGGHLGFVALPAYRTLLDLIYPNAG